MFLTSLDPIELWGGSLLRHNNLDSEFQSSLCVSWGQSPHLTEPWSLIWKREEEWNVVTHVCSEVPERSAGDGSAEGHAVPTPQPISLPPPHPSGCISKVKGLSDPLSQFG